MESETSEKLKKWLPWIVIIVIIAIAAVVLMGGKGVGPGAGLLGGMKVTPISPTAPPKVAAAQPSGWQVPGIGTVSPSMLLLLLLGGGGLGAYWKRDAIGDALGRAKAAGGVLGWIASGPAWLWQVARGGKKRWDVSRLSSAIGTELDRLEKLEASLKDYKTDEARKKVLTGSIGKIKKLLTEAKKNFDECVDFRWKGLEYRATDTTASAFTQYARSYYSFAKGNHYLMQAEYAKAKCVEEYYKQLLEDIEGTDGAGGILNGNETQIKLQFATEAPQTSPTMGPPPYLIYKNHVPESLKKLEYARDRIKGVYNGLTKEHPIIAEGQLAPLTVGQAYIKRGEPLKIGMLCYAEILPDFIRNLKRILEKDFEVAKSAIVNTYGTETVFQGLFTHNDESKDITVDLGGGNTFSLSEPSDALLKQVQENTSRDRTKIEAELKIWAEHHKTIFAHDYTIRKLFGYLFTLERAINLLTKETNPATMEAELQKALDGPPISANDLTTQEGTPGPSAKLKPFDKYCRIIVLSSGNEIPGKHMIAVSKAEKAPLYKAIKRLTQASQALNDSLGSIGSYYGGFEQGKAISDKVATGRLYTAYYYGTKALVDFAGYWNEFDKMEGTSEAGEREKKEDFFYVPTVPKAGDEHFIDWLKKDAPRAFSDLTNLTDAEGKLEMDITKILNKEADIIRSEKAFLSDKLKGKIEKWSPISNYYIAPWGEGMINISSFAQWLGEAGYEKAATVGRKVATSVALTKIDDINALSAVIDRGTPVLLLVHDLNAKGDEKIFTDHVNRYFRSPQAPHLLRDGILPATYADLDNLAELGLTKEDLPAVIAYYSTVEPSAIAFRPDEGAQTSTGPAPTPAEPPAETPPATEPQPAPEETGGPAPKGGAAPQPGGA